MSLRNELATSAVATGSLPNAAADGPPPSWTSIPAPSNRNSNPVNGGRTSWNNVRVTTVPPARPISTVSCSNPTARGT